MYSPDYLKNINKNIFPDVYGNRPISEGKEGDIVIYRGGTHISSNKKVTSRSFTEGKEYILSYPYSPDTSDGMSIPFMNHKGEVGENGHLSVIKDDQDRSNGWNAALFELKG